ncbi:epimerase [Agromyces sp. MMS24-K17]|uniref:epimerase n=1 Tax=Agromyces sp. MMS24-K17 TaxID=3372850 RepID=UPI003754D677
MTGDATSPEAGRSGAGSAPRRAVVAGWDGFIGRRVVDALAADGYAVARVGRRGPDATWSDAPALARAIDGADLVVNLAGKRVDCRYVDRNRDEILRSRLVTTRALREAIAGASAPPRTWLNASTATIYRHATDRPMTEADGELGTGFSVDVARAWEAEFLAGDLPGTRRVALRMAIVLGGPATDKLAALARFGLGGPQVDGPWFRHRRYRGIGPHPTPAPEPWHRTRGRQRFSWIHVDDVIGAIRFLVDERPDAPGATLTGPVNLAAPNPSDDRRLMAAFRRAVGAPIGLPAYRWMLEPAMWALRNEPELLLKSRWVLPGRLEAAGYAFRWPELEPAVRDVIRRGRAAARSGGEGRADADSQADGIPLTA